MRDLAEVLEPLAKSMSLLTSETTGSILKLREHSAVMANEVSAAARYGNQVINRLEKTIESIRPKLLAGVLALTVATSAAAVSIFCVWQRLFSSQAVAAEKWEAFETRMLPMLDPKTRDFILKMSQSSKKP